jgi:hypothetical protein
LQPAPVQQAVGARRLDEAVVPGSGGRASVHREQHLFSTASPIILLVQHHQLQTELFLFSQHCLIVTVFYYYLKNFILLI